TRDWLFLGLGLVLLRYTAIGGILVMLLGAYRLARPLLTESIHHRMTLAEIVLAVVAVSLLLAEDWLPLGPSKGPFVTILFVGALLASVMVTFRAFESADARLLRGVLRRKLLFLLFPAGVFLFGAPAWLGFAAVFGLLPQSVRVTRPVSWVAHAFPGFGR